MVILVNPLCPFAGNYICMQFGKASEIFNSRIQGCAATPRYVLATLPFLLVCIMYSCPMAYVDFLFAHVREWEPLSNQFESFAEKNWRLTIPGFSSEERKYQQNHVRFC